MIGSLMPKIPGKIANFPSCLIRCERQNKSITINSDKVLPPPPKLVKKFENGSVKMLGNALCAWKASKFSIVNTLEIGAKTELATAGPLMPKNQKIVQANP